MKVINLYGGPGSGKSTSSAGLFFLMKTEGYKVELVTEYAKDMVYEKRLNVLEDQIYIFAKQLRRLTRLENTVDYVITDSPLLLGKIYNNKYQELDTLIERVYNEFDNIDIFIKRTKKYQEYGRTQNEEDAKKIDNQILDLLQSSAHCYFSVIGNIDAPKEILDIVKGIQ